MKFSGRVDRCTRLDKLKNKDIRNVPKISSSIEKRQITKAVG
jgi:hypothetical protein